VGHAAKNGIAVASSARELLLSIEQYAFEIDCWVSLQVVLYVLVRDMQELHRVLIRHGLDPFAALRVIEPDVKVKGGDVYHDIDDDLYSSDEKFGNRSLIGNAVIARARMLKIGELRSLDILAAVFEAHEVHSPATFNVDWTDEELQIPYNTLSHILGWYRKELWIRLDTIRRELGLLMPDTLRRERIERAPPHVRNGLLSFFADYPHYDKNCFLIMPFRPTPQLKEVHDTIRLVLADDGFNVLRADDEIYAENVFTNIEVYMHGARFAVSVFERMGSDQHNANVALEMGYMLGMDKDVCLLKERTVAALPSDLQGRLYVEFDAFSISETISTSIRRWLRERRLIKVATK
jgi:hypothetical protein